jgi:hypothetical protein
MRTEQLQRTRLRNWPSYPVEVVAKKTTGFFLAKLKCQGIYRLWPGAHDTLLRVLRDFEFRARDFGDMALDISYPRF